MSWDGKCFICERSMRGVPRRYAKASTRLGQWDAVAVCELCMSSMDGGSVVVVHVGGRRRVVKQYTDVG